MYDPFKNILILLQVAYSHNQQTFAYPEREQHQGVSRRGLTLNLARGIFLSKVYRVTREFYDHQKVNLLFDDRIWLQLRRGRC